jgi:hypothetical protein
VEFNRRDVGYTIYSRLEEALRNWLRDRLRALYADRWSDQIPQHVWNKALEHLGDAGSISDPIELLDETDIPDIAEIVTYRKAFSDFFSPAQASQEAFRDYLAKLYELRTVVGDVSQDAREQAPMSRRNCRQTVSISSSSDVIGLSSRISIPSR